MAKYYVDVSPKDFKPGKDYSLTPQKERYDDGQWLKNTEVHTIEEAAYGDYGGYGTIGISNYRILKDRFPNEVASASGGHGYNVIIYKAEGEFSGPVSEELQEVLDGLKDYPIIDEGAQSEVESEKESEVLEQEWKGVASEIVIPTLAAYLEVDPDDDGLEQEIERLEELPAKDERAKERKESLWQDLALHVFFRMLHDSPGEWFEFDTHSGDASINTRRIQEWLKRQDESSIEEYLEPLLEEIEIGRAPTGILAPV